MSTTWELALWIIVPLGVPTVLGLLFLFYPFTIVKFMAGFYRSTYFDVLKQTPEQVDRRIQLPTDRALIGKRSEFAETGAKTPEKYEGLVLGIRLFGGILLFMAFIAASMVGFYFVSVALGFIQPNW